MQYYILKLADLHARSFTHHLYNNVRIAYHLRIKAETAAKDAILLIDLRMILFFRYEMEMSCNLL